MIPFRVRFSSLEIHYKFLLLCVSFCFCTLTHSASADSTSDLFASINQRLSHMQSVALYKAAANLAVEDIEREQQVVAASTESAALLGLEAVSVKAFFEAQIDAAKIIQTRRIAVLHEEPAPAFVPDLATQIRPALDTLGQQIVQLLASTIAERGRIVERDRAQFLASIEDKYLTVEDENRLFSALLLVRAAH